MKRIMMLLVLAVAMLTGANAQQLQVPELPLDPAVKMGKLDNGLTYYIRHNEWPEQRANFYIAQKVGSMQEEDDQRGLAHFLEHMCFNGTTHFPGNSLKTYLETIGVKFGENLNAYTSFDETVYNIDNVPVISNPQSIDSCLMILHDWSHDLLLEGKEIDKERGVIEEEWRMRSSAQQRILEKALPVLFEGSKYAHRMPIGTMEIVKNFPYETIRKYYRKWYRPDLQAIVVVGDVDVAAIEAKIKSIFSDIKPAPADAAKREYFTVAENKEPIFSVHSDKEQQRSQMNILWKHEAFPREMKNTALNYAQNYLIGAMGGMLRTRIAELLQKENPPFLGGGISFNDDYLVTNAMACAGFSITFADNQHKRAIEAMYREMLRAERFGFTVSEYERYREEYKASIENMYERRDKISNNSYVNEYIRHFLDNEAAPGIDWEHTNLIQIADQVSVEAINQTLEQLVNDRKGAAPVIFGMFPDMSNLMTNKLSLHFDLAKTNKYSDFGTQSRAFNADELAHLGTYIDRGYKLFRKRVADGRHMSEAQVEQIAQGHVWLGQDALKIKLVDQLGGLNEAVSKAAALAKLDKYHTASYPAPAGWSEMLLDRMQSGNYLDEQMRAALGEYYEPMMVVRNLSNRNPIQARLPFYIYIR